MQQKENFTFVILLMKLYKHLHSSVIFQELVIEYLMLKIKYM